jgi:hypothetical protein
MSEYGRLWQQVSDIRRSIKEQVPGVTLNTLAEARTEIAARAADMAPETATRVNAQLADWARLETRMEQTE